MKNLVNRNLDEFLNENKSEKPPETTIGDVFKETGKYIVGGIKGMPSDLKWLGKQTKGIFKTKDDKYIQTLFDDIKNTFDSSNISINYHTITYNHNSNIIEVEYGEPDFEVVGSYDLKINNENINCSYLLKRKIYNFLKNKIK